MDPKNLNVKAETIRLLEENIGETIREDAAGNTFFG